MNSNLKEFLESNFPGALTVRSRGVKVWDDPQTEYTSDKLCRLYELGFHSRDDEIFKLETTINLQNKLIQRKQQFQFALPWWIGLLIGLIATAHFYFTYLR